MNPDEMTRWDLSDLLPSPEAADDAIAELERLVGEMEALRDRLSPDMPEEEFLAAVRQYEAITLALHRLAGYAYLWFAEDTQDQRALAFRSKIEQLGAEIQNRVLFFSLWWKGLDDTPAQRLMRNAGDYRYFLESLRRFKPHTLTEPEERIINIKDVNGVNALITLYDMITNRFTFELEVDGEKKRLTREELMVYVRDPRPELRAAAYQELYRVYGEQGNLLGQIYAYRVRDWYNENLRLRHFATPIAVRNLLNDIPDAAVDTLLDICRENASVFQRYFRLKARWLGMDRLRRYDIYAPIAGAEKSYEYAEAIDLVLDTYQAFSPEMAEHARRVFAERHIDAEVRPGKQGGAFSYGVLPGLTPYVLLNYTGKARDVAVMAHELGHAIHSSLAGHHSVLTFHPSLPLAETASVFGEMLLTDRLLREEEDEAVRRDLLVAVLDDAYATVMRQAYFALFEREAHDLVNQGRTIDELCERYMGNLTEQFGDAVEISDEFRWEWVSIPHIYHTPFYVYAYSFGQLLVLSLYQRYKEEGETFKPAYLKILAYGGSESPQRILSEAGIDITSPEFWRGGFDVISGMIDELEAMEKK
ncbi:MAG TPA: M3 family oligoendopeptidase [Caldilineae bacterium]|nr:M3 family oligoendopeptidase [Caldilineae bacterium]